MRGFGRQQPASGDLSGKRPGGRHARGVRTKLYSVQGESCCPGTSTCCLRRLSFNHEMLPKLGYAHGNVPQPNQQNSKLGASSGRRSVRRRKSPAGWVAGLCLALHRLSLPRQPPLTTTTTPNPSFQVLDKHVAKHHAAPPGGAATATAGGSGSPSSPGSHPWNAGGAAGAAAVTSPTKAAAAAAAAAQCRECGVRFEDARALERHQLTAHNDAQYSCAKCRKAFSTAPELVR